MTVIAGNIVLQQTFEYNHTVVGRDNRRLGSALCELRDEKLIFKNDGFFL